MFQEHFLSLPEIDQITHLICSLLEKQGWLSEGWLRQPRIGLILGSGLGNLADSVQDAVAIPYNQIPGWPVSTVVGHAGKLIFGKLENQAVVVMQGRTHFYEGYSINQVGLPTRVLQRLGIEILIVTNAAGAVNPAFTPGDLMLITDHLNLIGMAGLSPLRGPNLAELGVRFPDMGRAYDRELAALARQAAAAHNILLQEGVYAGLAGPSFETPADLRFLRLIGTDAVGMSTVPEVTVARHGGTRVLGISGISNKANLDGETLTTHEEVLQAGQIIVPKLEMVLRDVLRRL
jgi:purine-nucleoside phosphorylase